jgi:hypothetical protein
MTAASSALARRIRSSASSELGQLGEPPYPRGFLGAPRRLSLLRLLSPRRRDRQGNVLDLDLRLQSGRVQLRQLLGRALVAGHRPQRDALLLPTPLRDAILDLAQPLL